MRPEGKGGRRKRSLKKNDEQGKNIKNR